MTPSLPTTLRRRLAGTLGAQGLVLALVAMQEILLLPFYLDAWGVALYRDWLVAMAAVEFLARLDFGLQNYFGNALLRHFTRGEQARYDGLRSEALVLYLALMAAGVVLLAVAAGTGFGIDTGLGGLGAATVLLLGLEVLVRLPFGVYGGIYRARGEPARAQYALAIQLTVRLTMMMAGLALGLAPVVLAAGILALSIATGIGFAIDQRRRYRESLPELARPESGAVRTALTTGLLYNVHAWGVTISTQGLVLAVAHWASDAGAVVMLTTARTLTGIARQIAAQTAAVAGVEQAREHAAGQRERLLRLHRWTLRVAGGVAGVLTGAIAVLGADILRVWGGGQVAYDPWLFAALIASILIAMPARAASQLATFTNRPQAPAIAHLAQAALLLGAAALTIPILGARGAALALLFSETLAIAVWLGRRAARDLDEPLSMQWRHGWGWAAIGIAGSGAAAEVARQVALHVELLTPLNVPTLIARLAFWGVAILPLLWLIAIPAEYRRGLRLRS